MAVAVDPPEVARELAGRLALGFPLLADEKRAVAQRLGVIDQENDIAWPAVFIVAPDGRVAWREISATYPERPSSARLLKAVDAALRASASCRDASGRGQEARKAGFFAATETCR